MTHPLQMGLFIQEKTLFRGTISQCLKDFSIQYWTYWLFCIALSNQKLSNDDVSFSNRTFNEFVNVPIQTWTNTSVYSGFQWTYTKSFRWKNFDSTKIFCADLKRKKIVDLTLFNIFAFDLTDIHVTKLSHQFERRAKVQNLYTKCTHSF